jgi:hypothetical protein
MSSVRSYEREVLTLNLIVPTTRSLRFTARGSGRRRRACLRGQLRPLMRCGC